MLPLKSLQDCLVYVHVPASEFIVQHNGKVVRSCFIPPVVLRGQPSKLTCYITRALFGLVCTRKCVCNGFVKGAECAIRERFENGYHLVQSV